MSELKHTISPLTPADHPAMAISLFEAKLPLTINRLLWQSWPNEEGQMAQYARTAETSSQNADMERLKVVDDASGNMIGHVVVTRKRPNPSNDHVRVEDSEGNKPVPEGMNEPVFRAVVSAGVELDTHKDIDHFGRRSLKPV
jgi:hypothetical protein